MTQRQGIPCMNCGKATPEGEAKLFAEVFVCETCFTMASRLYEKTEAELRGLLLVLKDRIREYLVQGKLHYSMNVQPPLSKRDLLQAIMMVEEQRHGPAKEIPQPRR